MAARIAAARAQFAHFPGEYLKPETRWRSELDSNSRATKLPYEKIRSMAGFPVP
jgi:hypothetical protein